MEIKNVGSITSFTMIIGLIVLLSFPVLIVLTNMNLQNSSPSQFIGLTIEGKPGLRKVIVQSRPVHNSESIKNWVKISANHFLNYNVNDFTDVIKDGRKYMTARFYNGFAMNHALRIKSNIESGYYISSSVVEDTPVLISKAVVNGKDYYKYYMRTSTVYKAEAKNAFKNHDLIVTVKMENPEDNLRGLAIDELIIK